MPNSNPLLKGSFKADKTIADDFREWIEKHARDMHATGCFIGNPIRVINDTDPKFKRSAYTHTFNGRRGKEAYELNFRPDFQGQFLDKWGGYLENGMLVANVVIGYEEELKL